MRGRISRALPFRPSPVQTLTGPGHVLRREPLVHFLLLAGLLFVFEHVWSATQKERIVVDRQTAEFLIQQREDLELRPLSPEERRETIDAYVEDEILYREAYKRGLDKEARMRRNLILKMRGLALPDLRDPTEDELLQHFESNRQRYRRPPTVSVEQVYFRDAASVPAGLLDELRSGREHGSLGEYLQAFGRSASAFSGQELAASLGPDAARAILALEDGHWGGPIESRRGVHFVRIVERRPARDAAYEDVRAYLAQDWALAQARLAVEREVESLRDDYEIVIETDGVLP